MGTQVGTVGIEDPSGPVRTAEEHEFTLEVRDRPYVARLKVRSRSDAEPAVR